MRRVALVLLVVAVAGATWLLWPATTWPRAFCAPVVRVIGTDANPISTGFSHYEPTLSTTQEGQVNKLMYDITLARGNAPTAQLRNELDHYLAGLGGVLTTNTVTDAMSRFDVRARTQLRACGVTPVGS
jgi:hypothetical protein